MDINETDRVRVGNGSGGTENTMDPSEIKFPACNLRDLRGVRIVLIAHRGSSSSTIFYNPGYNILFISTHHEQ